MAESPTVINGCTRLIALMSLAVLTSPVGAHTPHDNINFLVVSPSYEADATLFVGVLAHLQRSTDGGRSWKRLSQGLDNRSRITGVAISPAFSSDNTLFAATRGDGVYASVDAGDSWRKLDAQPESLNLAEIVLSPQFAADATMVAAGVESGLYLSTDGGDSWETMLRSSGSLQNLVIILDRDTLRLLVVDHNGVAKQRSISDISWQIIPSLPAKQIHLLRQTEYPGGGSLLVAASDEAIYTSEDHGRTFSPRPLPEGGLGSQPGRITAAARVRRDGVETALLVTAWHGGAYVSDLKQDSWIASTRGLTTDTQADEHRRPHFDDVVVRGDTVFLAAFDGLFRSDDGGSTWQELETLPAQNPTSFDFETINGVSDRLVVSTFDAGIYLSDDSGASWKSLNQGLADLHVWKVVFRPDLPGESQFLAATNQSIYSRGTHDSTWRRDILGCKGELAARSGLEKAWNRAKYLFTDKPRCRATFPHEIAFAPGRDGSSAIYFGTRYEGVFASKDNGAKWNNVHNAFGGWVSQIVTVPGSQRDGSLLVSIRGKGILRSSSHGDEWQQLANREMLSIVEQNPSAEVPVAVSPNFGGEGIIFVGTAAGLFASRDSGDSWRQVEVSDSRNEGVLAIALSPDFAEDGFLLVSIKGRGLYVSYDFARTFAPIAEDLIEANHVLRSIKFTGAGPSSQKLYAMSDEALFVSSNRGKTWQIVPRPSPYEVAIGGFRLEDE